MSGPERQNESLCLVAVHLTGPHRGTRQYLDGAEATIGSGPSARLHFPASEAPGVAALHGTLRLGLEGPELEAAPGQSLFVNGEASTVSPIGPGDVIEIGAGGPILRLRPASEPPGEYKTIPEAVRDCADCARFGSDSLFGRAWIFVTGIPRELLQATRPAVRALFVLLLLASAASVLALSLYTRQLERSLDADRRRLATIEAAVQASREGLNSDLTDQLAELQAELSGRIGALESRDEAARQVVSDVAQSVVFLQGSYSFRDPDQGRPLRLILERSGASTVERAGQSRVSVDGDGPVFETRLTGSAFVVGPGLLITNRHVAMPWEFDLTQRDLLSRGFQPQLRMLGYLPGVERSFSVQLERASPTADLALLRSDEMPSEHGIELAEASPALGTEVIVLGYPTGIHALLARTSGSVADSLIRASGRDFWAIARGLSEADLIRPLVTRGIIGQVTDASVVYDAVTTTGGSGGPVLALDGSVVAVTVGVMVDFDGSNLGVPVAEVNRFLRDADGP